MRTNSGLPWLQRSVLKIPNVKKTVSIRKKCPLEARVTVDSHSH